jgi:macrolide transport system ATP-binding/permease protein
MMSILRRFRNLLRRERLNREIDEEMRAHMAMRAEDNESAGMTAQEARRHARLRFGSSVAMREAAGEAGSLPRLENLIADLRYAWRQLLRYPGFSVIAIAVLAIGVGAGMAIFAFVDAVLIRPLPYRAPQQLVGMYESSAFGPHFNLSYPDYLDWKRMSRSFTAIEAYASYSMAMKTASGLELVGTGRVSAGFLRMLGVTPVLGRDFHEGEDGKDAAPTALMSYAAWQRRYGMSKSALGQTVVLEDQAYQVIGVLPQGFSFAGTGEAEFLIPLKGSAGDERGDHWFSALGRLREGVSLRSAQAEMSGVAANLARQYPDSDGARGATVESWTELVVGEVRPVLLLLMAGSILLLSMACVNVSSLLLVRTEKRRREVAVRGALGASRLRLMRQFVVEGLLLAGIGSALGVAAACGAIPLLRSSIPEGILDSMPYLRSLGLSWHVVGFAVAATVLTGVLFALTPLLRLTGTMLELGGGLHGEGRADSRTATGGLWRQMGARLVVVQLMLAVVLLTGAGLLTRSLYLLVHTDLGMEANNLALVHLRMPPNATELTKPTAVLALKDRAVDLARQMPGVEDVAISRHLPVNNGIGSNTAFLIVGRPPSSDGSKNVATQRMVSPNLFATLKTRLMRGRFFTEEDDASHPLVAIVNAQLARRYFPGEDAIGKQLQIDATEPRMTIVGVIEDMREGSLDGDTPAAIYQPFEQNPEEDFFVVARVSSDPEVFAQTLETKLRGLRSDLLVYSAETMEDRIRNTQAAGMHRASAALVGGFAVLALVLSAVGLYGVIAYSVSQRTREIGVRMALGASRENVSGMVLREAGLLAGIGLSLGLVCAIGAAVLMRSLLYGTAPWDLPTLVSVMVLLGVCALFASWLPARRAASVNPMDALRAE